MKCLGLRVLLSLLAIHSPLTVHSDQNLGLYSFPVNYWDIVFNDHLVFESTTVSILSCVVQCCQQACCALVTFLPTSASHGTCRGHQHFMKPLSSTFVPGCTGMEKKSLTASGQLINAALKKPAQQSTTFMTAMSAGLAVDGSSRQTIEYPYTDISCSHTEKTPGQRSWWQVDLTAQYDICFVVITNRDHVTCGMQECVIRFRDFDIHVYREDPVSIPGAAATLCHHYDGVMPLAVSETLACDPAPATGRYVRITNVLYEVLTLCEVEVMAQLHRPI